jgi:hypothetical protein
MPCPDADVAKPAAYIGMVTWHVQMPMSVKLTVLWFFINKIL